MNCNVLYCFVLYNVISYSIRVRRNVFCYTIFTFIVMYCMGLRGIVILCVMTYCNIIHNSTSYQVIQQCRVLKCRVVYCIVLCCIALYCVVLCCIVL